MNKYIQSIEKGYETLSHNVSDFAYGAYSFLVRDTAASISHYSLVNKGDNSKILPYSVIPKQGAERMGRTAAIIGAGALAGFIVGKTLTMVNDAIYRSAESPLSQAETQN